MKTLIKITTTLLMALVAFNTYAISNEARLLKQICPMQFLHGNSCQQARDYPDVDKRRCNVDITPQSTYEGRFLTTSSHMLIIGYGSDCEPHSNNFGGSLIYVKDATDKDYVFNSYQPGLTIENCITVSEQGRKDRLVCETGGTGQGFTVTNLTEVIFSQDIEQNIKPSFDMIKTATSSKGAYGIEVADCKNTDFPQFVSFSIPKQTSQANAIHIKAEYIDQPLAKAACSHPLSGPDKSISIPSGMAPVKKLISKDFILDLGSRTLTPLAK